MNKEEFNDLIKDKNEHELKLLIELAVNEIIKLNNNQLKELIRLKNTI